MNDIAKNILKGLGIIISIPILLIILLIIGLKTYQYITDNNYSKIIKKEEFKNLEILISNKKEIQNIAILPKKNYISINNVIINRKNKTYGDEPELGFYMNLYKAGNQNKYKSLDLLLNSISVNLNKKELDSILEAMDDLGVQDIIINTKNSCNEIVYRWKVSGMWGEEGLIWSDCEIEETKMTQGTRICITKIDEGYYEYYR